MTNVFVSYRRRDSRASTGRIADRLRSHFGESAIFQDIQSIGLGVDFRTALSERLDQCDVFLAIIGDEWLTASEDGQRRIDSPDDAVRQEVAAALARENIPVIPVLVGEAPMPSVDELPKELKELHYRNAIEIPSDDTFDPQVAKLIDAIDSILGIPAEAEPQAAEADAPAAAAEPAAPSPPSPAPDPSGGGMIKIAGLVAVVAIAAFGVWQFRCALLGQCVDIYFDHDYGSTHQIYYGDTEEIQLIANDKSGEPLKEIPPFKERYEFDFDSADEDVMKFKDSEEGGDPSAGSLYGVQESGVSGGVSEIEISILDKTTEKLRKLKPIVFTISYDPEIAARVTKAIGDMEEDEVLASKLVEELTDLTTKQRDRVQPNDIATLDSNLAQLGALAQARSDAMSADPATTTVGARLTLWETWETALTATRDLAAEEDSEAYGRMSALEGATRLNGELATYASCQTGNPPSCSGQKSEFRQGDDLYIGMTYKQPDSGDRNPLTIRIAGRAEPKTVTATNAESFTYTMVRARPAGENVEIKAFNSNGDLVGSTTVTIR